MTWHPNDLTNHQLITRACEAKNGENFRRHWSGDDSLWRNGPNDRYFDESSAAALTLCRMLVYWTGRNRERVEDLFHQSGLASKVRPDLDLDEIIDLAMESHDATAPEQDVPSDQDPSLATALELASQVSDVDDWTYSFELARRLRKFSEDNPDQFEPAVRAFCEKTGHNFDDFWDHFLGVWNKVLLVEGQDPIEWALCMARREPVLDLPPLRTPRYALLAGMAFHLWQLRQGQPFCLPVCERLASLLSTTKMTLSRSIEVLLMDGVIELANEKYNRHTGQARTFRWTWTEPQERCSA
jgi:hypothetical protein